MMFPGHAAFRLKDEKGVPLSMIVELCTVIEWPSFIEAARAAGWYDFQTLAQIKAALFDADADEVTQREIVQRFKLYVLANPHPCMETL